MKPKLKGIIVIGIIIFVAVVVYINLSIKSSLKNSRNTVVNVRVGKKKMIDANKPAQTKSGNKDVEKEPPLSSAPLAY